MGKVVKPDARTGAAAATELEVPAVGMRGGLGRTLLTAFLIMAIVPLSVVSWYATDRGRSSIQHEVTEKLVSVAAFKEAQISRWVEERVADMSLLSGDEQLAETLAVAQPAPEGVRTGLQELALRLGGTDMALLDPAGRVAWASEAGWEGDVFPLDGGPAVEGGEPAVRTFIGWRGQTGIVLVAPADMDDRWPYVAARFDAAELARLLGETAGLGQTGQAYLVGRDGMALPQGDMLSGPAVQAALAGQAYQGLYTNYAHVPVIGAYRWLPACDMALFVEQSQEEAFAGNDAVAAAVIAATLGAAMATAVIAAFVTRQITRPVVELTESALRIAGGDLSQRVEVSSRDEIGILAHVFNRMGTELEALYNDLEAKVAQRTELLQRANYLIQRRAIQMQASLEVWQAIISVLDPDRLLVQVVSLIRDRFVYSYVAVYTLDPSSGMLSRRAAVGQADPSHGELIPLDRPDPLSQVAREGQALVINRPIAVKVGPPAAYTRSEVVLPLRLGEGTLGVLHVQSTAQEEFDPDEVSVLQNVAHQIAVALENARVYAMEREAAERLRELDRSKRRFLENMSHELRTPLTNIIGFSRLMLKEIDGPLNEQQREDLQIIYHNSQHLLGLINDLLDVSQIEAGMMELERRELDLADLIHSVMATASALVRDRGIALRTEIAEGLPLVPADPARIRQVLLRLLTNAAKFTSHGEICVRAWSDADHVYVSVRDTGIGIPPLDRERIFERFEQGALENGRRPDGAGLGLALSKEFVELHGGTIEVESEWGKGSTFTFSLPLRPDRCVEGDVS